MKNEENLRDKIKIALTNTFNTLCFKFDQKDKYIFSKENNFFKIEKFNKKYDIFNLRGEIDSEALKFIYSNVETYKKMSL